jgi:hypothetical protein
MYAAIPATTQEIASVIEKLIANGAEPIALRCTAADVMGRLDYKDPVLPPPEPTARELGYLALVACNSELTRLEDLHKQDEMRSKSKNRFSGGLGGGMGMPGMGGAGGAIPGGAAGGAMRGGMTPGMGAKSGGLASGPPDLAGKMTPGGMSGGKKGKGKKTKGIGQMGGAVMPQDMMGGGAGSDLLAPADPKTYRLDNVRRRLRAWLFAVQMGLGNEVNLATGKIRVFAVTPNAKTAVPHNRGVAAYAKADQEKTYVTDVMIKVQDVIKVVEDQDLEYDDFLTDVREQMKALESITKPLEQPKAEAAEPADDVPGSAAPARAAAATKGGAAPAAAAPDVPDAAEVPGAVPLKPAATPEVPAARRCGAGTRGGGSAAARRQDRPRPSRLARFSTPVDRQVVAPARETPSPSLALQCGEYAQRYAPDCWVNLPARLQGALRPARFRPRAATPVSPPAYNRQTERWHRTGLPAACT